MYRIQTLNRENGHVIHETRPLPVTVAAQLWTRGGYGWRRCVDDTGEEIPGCLLGVIAEGLAATVDEARQRWAEMRSAELIAQPTA